MQTATPQKRIWTNAPKSVRKRYPANMLHILENAIVGTFRLNLNNPFRYYDINRRALILLQHTGDNFKVLIIVCRNLRRVFYIHIDYLHLISSSLYHILFAPSNSQICNAPCSEKPEQGAFS